MPAEEEMSAAAVQLIRGVVYRDSHEQVWSSLPRLKGPLRDHFDVLGLQVVVDEAEGYAYLRSRPEEEGMPSVPRLVARRTLSFQVSLVLALLRKRLAEFDASSSEQRLVLTREQIVEMVGVFVPQTSNEAKLLTQLDTTVGKVVDLGFLRPVPRQEGSWEVRRIIKAFVDAQWLGELDQRLTEYADTVRSPSDDPVASTSGPAA